MGMATQIPAPTHPTCSRLHRYQSPEHLERLKTIILRHELYLPSVSQLNDPTDCRPKLAQLTVEEMESFLLGGYVLSHAREPLDELAKQIAVVRVNVQKHGLDWCMREAARLLNAQMERIRVYSLTKRFDNLSLWAKYAADHTGYCLEFVNDGPLFGNSIEVIYGECHAFHLLDPAQRTPRFLIYKRPEWSNEEEVRLIRERNSKPTVNVDPRWLTRIIIGKDMTEENEGLVRSWAKQRVPQLCVARAYFDELDQRLTLKD